METSASSLPFAPAFDAAPLLVLAFVTGLEASPLLLGSAVGAAAAEEEAEAVGGTTLSG